MLSDKAIQEYKEIYKKEYGKDISDSEAQEQGERLTRFFDVLFQIAQKEHKRKLRLKKEPKGFHLDEDEGPYNCRVCHQLVSGKEAWWDLNGVKCLDCQRNIEEKIIPGEICQNDNLWIRNWELQYEYGLHSSTIRKLKREGILYGRDLKTKDGTTYHTVYLKNENKEFLKKYPKKPKMKFKFINAGEKKVQL